MPVRRSYLRVLIKLLCFIVTRVEMSILPGSNVIQYITRLDLDLLVPSEIIFFACSMPASFCSALDQVDASVLLVHSR